MSARLTAIEIATRALRLVGEVTPRDEPDGHVLKRALEELDTVIADVISDQRCWWFVRRDVPLNYIAGTATYAVPNNGDEPTQSVLEAYAHVSGSDRPVDIIPLREYEAIDKKTQVGAPEVAIVTHGIIQQQMTVWPVPDQAYTGTLVVVVEAPDVTKATGRTKHGLRTSWQGWAIDATAWRCSRGPVRNLPIPEQRELERVATGRLETLFSYDNREPRSSRRQTRRYFT